MRNLIFVTLLVTLTISVASMAGTGNESKHSWPAIKPVKKSIHFLDHQKMGTKLNIVGLDETPVYLLECYLNAYNHKDNDFDYTGDFECRLTSLYDDHQAHRTLLSAERPQTRDWQSRGVFYIDEIEPKYVEGIPIKYPGYGRARSFRLRGMALTLEIKNFKLESGSDKKSTMDRNRIKELELDVTVTSDPSATYGVAEPLKYDTSLFSRIKWPEILPIMKTIHFVDHQEGAARLKVVGKNSTPLYLLECYLNAYDHEDRNFDYSGDFECRFTSLYDDSHGHSTLLIEDPYPTRDWQSRGRFLIEELKGKCAEYPEYGRIRHFRLRGMNLMLEIKAFKIKPGSSAENSPWNRDRIKELELYVTITPDAKALSEIAEPTKYIRLPSAHPEDPNDLLQNCDKVLMK